MATRTVTLARMNRWAILAGFGLLAACTQLLWLTYAPITTQVHRVMGVSVGAAGDLAAIFPLMYVLLALPSGRSRPARSSPRAAACCAWSVPPRTGGRWPGSSWWPLASLSC